MSFSAFLGVWHAAVHAGSPGCVATSVAPRALATTPWANRWKGPSCRQRNANPSQQDKLTWCNNPTAGAAAAAAAAAASAVAPARLCCVARRSLSAMSASGGAAGEGVSFVETEAAQRRNGDPGCVAFVTGANRGIGLEVTRQLLSRTKGELLAP